MNALELADYFDDADGSVPDAHVAAMLRKQDAAIKQLREALERIQNHTEFTSNSFKIAANALGATESLT